MHRLAAMVLPRRNWPVVVDCAPSPRHRDYGSELRGDKDRHRRLESGPFRIEHADDCGGHLFPLAMLACKFAPSFFGEGVKTGFAIVL
jgi:hypothetical protein